MSRAVLVSLLAAGLSACATDQRLADRDAVAPEAEARAAALADRFQKELLTALTAAMQNGGPASAVGVCSTIAPSIARNLSEESGATVRRTALRTRNPAAEPDTLERRTMENWSEAPMGVDGRPAQWSGWDGGEYRYMRAIPTMPMCLTCHGENVAPEVKAAIQAHYPSDQATGFKAGQMRGAFSIQWDEKALQRLLRKDAQS